MRVGVLIVLFALGPLLMASDGRRPDDPWVPMEERIKIWDEVVAKELGLSLPLREPKPYTISANGLEATFVKDGAKWTIIGANAPIVNPTVYPKDWPVKGDGFEVLVIPEPITNYKILPFTEKIENAVKSDTITITAAKDSYEPASFVIRSGDKDLKDVMIEVTDLKAKIKDKNGKIKTAVIPKENIDVRVVKCWYQAGVKLNELRNKMLTPELLIHDDRIVKVDHDHQVNIICNRDRVEDAATLKSFSISKQNNKQIWLTLHVNKDLSAGEYQGVIRIKTPTMTKELNLTVEALPFSLPAPMLDYVLYYDGYLSNMAEVQIGGNTPKTASQMKYEFIDMKEYGLTNIAIRHNFAMERNKWDDNWKSLRRTISLRNEIGFDRRVLLYVDWGGMRFNDRQELYKEKVKTVVSIAKEFDFEDVYIYGIDEKHGIDLLLLRPLYKIVRDAGAKNFVACQEDFLLYVPDLLDRPILAGRVNHFFMDLLHKLGIKAWNYTNPPAGLEEPETYRHSYGVRLLYDGFSGVCLYIYQHGDCWSDNVDNKVRSYSMTYPTVLRPVSTVQWEGWRAGINDVRYLTLLKQYHGMDGRWLKENCMNDVSACRQKVVTKLLAQPIRG